MIQNNRLHFECEMFGETVKHSFLFTLSTGQWTVPANWDVANFHRPNNDVFCFNKDRCWDEISHSMSASNRSSKPKMKAEVIKFGSSERVHGKWQVIIKKISGT